MKKVNWLLPCFRECIIDASAFTEIAQAQVPHHIPFGFHGLYTSTINAIS